MPITQDRFLSVINAASDILDTQSRIRSFTSDSGHVISRANSVLQQTEDQAAQQIIRELLATLHTIQDIIQNSHDLHLSANATVLAEKQYFARVRRSNEKSAFYQRQARRRLGIPTRNERALADEQEMERILTEEKIAKERADNERVFGALGMDAKAEEELELMRRRGSAKVNTSAGASYERNVLSTSIPSLDDLNELPIPKPGEGNVL